MAPAEFTGRLRNANPLTLFRGGERPKLYRDILDGLDDANKRLDFERAELCKRFAAAGELRVVTEFGMAARRWAVWWGSGFSSGLRWTHWGTSRNPIWLQFRRFCSRPKC
jgi:hypothetical protein